jgi:RNA polymerase sigma factor (sigma-70 family)
MGEASLPLPDSLSERVPQRALGVLPDTRLARLAAEGSQGAFAAIYERHHQALYRYCHSILGNTEDAKDALQNTMVSALRALPGEKREIALRPWLFSVAHNEAISVLRHRSPQVSIDEADDVAAIAADATVRERLRALFEDLHELPDRQRAALVMRELNGLSYADIGAALDASETAAKQIVYEARTALHELEEGREMQCEAARKSISARDGRVMRGRKLRAHLRSCDGCRSFRDAISERRTDLKALAPPLPAAAAATILSGAIGGGGGGSVSGGGGIAAVFGTAGESVAGTAGIKAAAIAVAAGLGLAGAGVLVGAGDPVSNAMTDDQPVGADSGAVEQGASAHNPGEDLGGSQAHGGPGTSAHHTGTSPAGGDGGGGSAGAGDAGAGEDAGAGPGADAPGEQGPGPSSDNPGGGGGSEPGGQDPPSEAGGGGGGSPDPPSNGPPSDSPPPSSPPPSGGSSGHGPIGTPPGHGGTPPGQGGTPPGLAGQPPGLGGTPPGQGGTPPGQGK